MHVKTIHLICLSLAFVPACVVEASDDDDAAVDTDGNGSNADSGNSNAEDGSGGSSNGDDADGDDADGDDSNGSDTNGSDTNGSDTNGSDTNGSDTNGSDTNGDDTNGDDSSGDDGPIGDAIPQEGAWHYSETGGTTNACTFLPQPTNGWGQYLVQNASASGFVIVPGDDSGAFDCDLADGEFHCPERLVESIDHMGIGVVTNVYVEVEGQMLSSTEMAGSQIGHIECQGALCAKAAAYFGVTFPCTFEVPFTGDKT